ncbi:MAG TPA: SDR family oxidoreductase [Bacteroidales bacterium]|nr:SDR family oxidoreductase [Bacteroidales bacterium]
MKILLSGVTGYVGKRLLPVLAAKGHDLVCCVRDKQRFAIPEEFASRITVVEVDFLSPVNIGLLPPGIDAAYYLIHSMSTAGGEFYDLEAAAAGHFVAYMEQAGVKQVIYLSGIVNEEKLSKHLASRKNVEDILEGGTFHLTVLRAGIIVGSGSASFEIIRDLVEKLPVMITPRWVLTRSQPVAITDVIAGLSGVLGNQACYDRSFDIGGPDVLTYRQMLLEYAEVRGLRRYIFTVPVMTPRLSSYWLYFVTRVSYKLAVNLVESMKMEVVVKNNDLFDMLGISPLSYKSAIHKAFAKIEQNHVVSSWKDALNSSMGEKALSSYIEVPGYGCFHDRKEIKVEDPEQVLDNLWAIGGDRGWYYADWLWKIRGFMDKLAGGVGLRRGRTDPVKIRAGDALDFWRVLFADRNERRLMLYAEMKLPGEAWLEFTIDKNNVLKQVATFRPRGLAGRMYWFSVYPFHLFVFRGMIRNIAGFQASRQ